MTRCTVGQLETEEAQALSVHDGPRVSYRIVDCDFVDVRETRRRDNLTFHFLDHPGQRVDRFALPLAGEGDHALKGSAPSSLRPLDPRQHFLQVDVIESRSAGPVEGRLGTHCNGGRVY